MSDEPLFPFRPGDWVMTRSGRVAKVKSIDCWNGEFTFDLVLYSLTGEKIGRESPALGGPRTFEPSCSLEGWERCREPDFPLAPQWVMQPDGSRLAMYWSERLPPAQYRKPKPRRPRGFDDFKLRRALEKIAGGDNDARATARTALGWEAAE